LYGCETWSPTLKEEQRLRLLENRMLRVFGPKEGRGEWRGYEEDYIIIWSYITCTLHHTLIG